ncbi:MAG TPA: hypothetical protein VFC65_01750 [Prolixibacteraceae bacterium]|nr:hypothetical protein [Prolixibacteraceae bacterium]
MKASFDEFQSDRMISDPGNYKWGIFYFNQKDGRVVVPRYNKRMGWTLNFANIYSFLIILGLIEAVLASVWFG